MKKLVEHMYKCTCVLGVERLLGFELSSVIVDSLSFKRDSKVESDGEQSSRLLVDYSRQRVN